MSEGLRRTQKNCWGVLNLEAEIGSPASKINETCIASFLPQIEIHPKYWIGNQAGAPGFEPGSTDPKSAVLPLHHAPMTAPGYAEREKL